MSTEKALSSQAMDEQRHMQTAYEYLCRLEEAKKWIEHNLHIELPSSSELEDSLRNGVVLARLANFYAPDLITEKKIYDINYKNFQKKGLHYKYTDNIINFLNSLSHIGFPKVFFPETTDIYDRKNMPKLIYCIHALSMYLYKLGKAYPIQDLMGKVEFSEDELKKVSESLKKYGVQMPAFSKIGGILASELSEDDAALHAAILLIDEALDTNDANLLLERLKNVAAQLFGVHDEHIDDYMQKLKSRRAAKIDRAEKACAGGASKEQEDVYDRRLTQKEIQETISKINLDHLLVELTQHSRAKNEEKFIDCLVSRDMNSRCVLYDNRDLYMKRFHKHVKQQPDSYVLDMATVNELVSQGNTEAELRKRIVSFVTALNSAIHELTPELLTKYIDDFKVELHNYDPKLADSYTQWLRHRLEKKIKETNDPKAVLWFDEVEACIVDCNKALLEAKRLLSTIEALNQHVMSQSESVNNDIVYQNLVDLGLGGLAEACKGLYAENICKMVTKQNFVDWNGWTDHQLSSSMGNQRFYYNHNDQKFKWFEEVPLQPLHGYINKRCISEIVNGITSHYNNELYLQANSPSITLIQAFHRTHKVHLSYVQRPLIVLLQSLFRTLSVMKMYKKVNQFNKDHLAEIECLQKFARIVIARQPYSRQFEQLKQHVDTIVSLQSVIRANLAHRDYHNLVHSENPPCSTVCRFVRLLDFDANDMKEEKELEHLRNSVVSMIKLVNEKEAENKEIDVRIGLLVKNKLKIQDVLTHSQGKSKKLSEQFLPSITKDKQILIDKLGTLFYILQMHPEYTAHLIMTFFGDRNSKFVKDTCYALYNYGTYLRDEYTLIKMFSCAMVVEIETKIHTINEFIKGDPLILKIAVHFYRNSKAQTWLEDVVSECVKDVVNNKYNINTNPLDIYKQWISQIETETGQASGYPYDVDSNTAMSYDEVKKRLSVNISNMKGVCSKFIEAITGSASKIPYGIRYLARTLYDSLKKRFPDEPESSYHKIVGNLLYYRLINPAIVSPDTFNMLSSSEISAEKRKNLASISVVIQRSASHNFSVGASADNPMLSLNEFMASTWTKITNWFDECMRVDNLEAHFNIDEFTDQTAISRPELNLTIGQIVEVHTLVKDYIEDNNIPKDDPICVVMDEIGELPAPSELVEHRKTNETLTEEQINDAVMNTNINLPLIAPKVDLNQEETKKKRLFLDTIKYVVDLLNFEATDNFKSLLTKVFSPAEEARFSALQLKRSTSVNEFRSVDEPPTANQTDNNTLAAPTAAAKALSLSQTQQAVIENTKQLESLGVIPHSDDYQSLILAVAKEIRNRRLYRKNRRFDLLRLRSALENLNTKDKYLTEQKDYYKQYIQACLANLNQHTSKKSKSSKSKKVVKYNAAELYKQGVVLEVEGLSTNQFKNVQFEINATDNPGVFSISAKLFGVSMDSMQLVFEDLLQLQYENVSVIYMFDRAKVNVNLLIYTINKKFYSKK